MISDAKFAAGPTVGRENFDAGRSSVQFDRGPWPTLEEYLTAIGHRENSCVKHVSPLPKSPLAIYGPGIYQPARERKLKATECYLAMVKYLYPTNQSIRSPCLWHSDLHAENIFVDPETPTKIMGIIDWQSTESAPLFYQARQPQFLDHNGPQIAGLERPRYPGNLAELDNAAQKEAKSLYEKQALSALYKTFVHTYIPHLYRALEYQESSGFDLLLFARNLLVDGEAAYLARAVELERTWADLPGVAASSSNEDQYPFHFSDVEKTDIENDMNGSLLGMQVMQGIQESLGDLFPEQGVVKPDQYEEAKDALRQAKKFVIQQFARNEEEKKKWEEKWPFDS